MKSFVIYYKIEYDVLYICISHVHKMFEARDIILSNRH